MKKMLNCVVLVLLTFSADICWSQVQKTSAGSWNWTLAATPMGNSKVEGILIDPEDANLWYVSAIDSGLYITRDGGVTWEHPFADRGLDLEGLQIDPADANIVYVTVWDKLYKSANKGATWQHLYTCPEYIRSILISKKDHAIYLGPQTTDNNTPGLYKSTDGGASFTLMPFGVSTHNLICWDIEEDPVNGILYVPIEIADHPQPYKPPFFRSMDGGKTWDNISGTLNWHALKVQVDTSSSAVYYQVEGGDLYRSSNFGNDWQLLNSSYFMNFLLDQEHPNRLYGGRPASITGGVYYSSNSGQSFTEIGLPGLSITALALTASDPKLYAVAYGSGIWVSPVPADLGAERLVVTNTNDAGAQSLREAITLANNNPGADTIRFAIPQTDPGFDSNAGTWTIRPLSSLPAITDSSLVIDGYSQAAFIGADRNPDGPEIVINGSQAGAFADGLKLLSAKNVIQHLVINGFAAVGIFISGENARDNRIIGNYLGTNAAGNDTLPNLHGIYVAGAAGTRVGGREPGEGNLLSGNQQSGLYVVGDATHDTQIMGNYIGTNALGTAALANMSIGLSLYASDNIVGGSRAGERNLISGNHQPGVRIAGDRNIVLGNYIGTDVTGRVAVGNQWEGLGIWGGNHNIIGGTKPGEGNLISANQTGVLLHTNDNIVTGNRIGPDIDGNKMGNLFSGIHLSAGARRNQLGPGNVIAYNGLAGVRVYGSNDSTAANTITENSIYGNAAKGIDLSNDGNDNAQPPVIESVTGSLISGQARAHAVVEIFSDSEDEGQFYEATVDADNTGHFEWATSPGDSVAGPYITATMTDENGNTSEFSPPFELVTSVEDESAPGLPAAFSLLQNYPNPFNPATTIRYRLAHAGEVDLLVYDPLGRKIATLVHGKQIAGSHVVQWHGRDEQGKPVPSGVYLLRLQAGSSVQVRKMILLR